VYGSKRIMLPNAKFMVFYNGIEKYPEHCELRLSDMYINQDEETDLELVTRVINISPGMNTELMEKCPILAEYSTYISLVREYARIMPLEKAVDKSVDECIENDILRKFLRHQKAEGKRMSLYEYNEEVEMEKIRRSEREIGIETGLERGRIALCFELINDGTLTLEQAAEKLNMTVEELEKVKKECVM